MNGKLRALKSSRFSKTLFRSHSSICSRIRSKIDFLFKWRIDRFTIFIIISSNHTSKWIKRDNFHQKVIMKEYSPFLSWLSMSIFLSSQALWMSFCSLEAQGNRSDLKLFFRHLNEICNATISFNLFLKASIIVILYQLTITSKIHYK